MGMNIKPVFRDFFKFLDQGPGADPWPRYQRLYLRPHEKGGGAINVAHDVLNNFGEWFYHKFGFDLSGGLYMALTGQVSHEVPHGVLLAREKEERERSEKRLSRYRERMSAETARDTGLSEEAAAPRPEALVTETSIPIDRRGDRRRFHQLASRGGGPGEPSGESQRGVVPNGAVRSPEAVHVTAIPQATADLARNLSLKITQTSMDMNGPITRDNFDATDPKDVEVINLVQKALKSLGFYNQEINGKFDDSTYAAIKKFQEENFIFHISTGKIDVLTAQRFEYALQSNARSLAPAAAVDNTQDKAYQETANIARLTNSR